MPGYKITPEDYAKLRDELYRLKTVERARVREEIAKTRAFGDLRENAEYAAAKEAQAILEARIAGLESKLSLAEVIAGEQFSSTEVAVGMTVVLRDLEIGKETAFTLVSVSDLATGESCVSLESPLKFRGHHTELLTPPAFTKATGGKPVLVWFARVGVGTGQQR